MPSPATERTAATPAQAKPQTGGQERDPDSQPGEGQREVADDHRSWHPRHPGVARRRPPEAIQPASSHPPAATVTAQAASAATSSGKRLDGRDGAVTGGAGARGGTTVTR